MFFIFSSDILSWAVILFVAVLLLGLILFTPLGLIIGIVALAYWFTTLGKEENEFV